MEIGTNFKSGVPSYRENFLEILCIWNPAQVTLKYLTSQVT